MLDLEKHLKEIIIPFWTSQMDIEHGGFYGLVDNNLVVHKEANKSIIAHSRHLYSFSLLYRYFKDETLLKCATHAYEFLEKAFKDHEHGGYFWQVDYKGKLISDTKHVYAQSFVIYGLSEYAQATQDEDVASEAYKLFELVESKTAMKPLMYTEQNSRTWKEEKNALLSCDPEKYPYTTNTMLHLLESYTNLYLVKPTEKLQHTIKGFIKGFKETVYNQKDSSFYMFFDKDFNPTFDGKSYGHDIETCWLIDRSKEVLNIEDSSMDTIIEDVVESVYMNGLTDKGLINEKINGITYYDRIWWAQVEAMVGFMNQYQKSGIEKYREAVDQIYQFCMDYLVDKRDNSEWFWGYDQNFELLNRGISESWKEPYHSVRAVIELLRRGLK